MVKNVPQGMLLAQSLLHGVRPVDSLCELVGSVFQDQCRDGVVLVPVIAEEFSVQLRGVRRDPVHEFVDLVVVVLETRLDRQEPMAIFHHERAALLCREIATVATKHEPPSISSEQGVGDGRLGLMKHVPDHVEQCFDHRERRVFDQFGGEVQLMVGAHALLVLLLLASPPDPKSRAARVRHQSWTRRISSAISRLRRISYTPGPIPFAPCSSVWTRCAVDPSGTMTTPTTCPRSSRAHKTRGSPWSQWVFPVASPWTTCTPAPT